MTTFKQPLGSKVLKLNSHLLQLHGSKYKHLRPLSYVPPPPFWSAFMGCNYRQASKEHLNLRPFLTGKRGLTQVDIHTMVSELHQKKKKSSVSLPRDSCFYNRNMFFPPPRHGSSLSHSPPFSKPNPHLSQSLEASQGDGDCTEAAAL